MSLNSYNKLLNFHDQRNFAQTVLEQYIIASYSEMEQAREFSQAFKVLSIGSEKKFCRCSSARYKEYDVIVRSFKRLALLKPFQQQE